MTMSVNETLARFAAHARGSIDNLLDNSGKFDIDIARQTGAINLVKKLKIKTRRYFPKDGNPQEEITHEIELYDTQNALTQIGKVHALFTDRTATNLTAAQVGLQNYLQQHAHIKTEIAAAAFAEHLGVSYTALLEAVQPTLQLEQYVDTLPV